MDSRATDGARLERYEIFCVELGVQPEGRSQLPDALQKVATGRACHRRFVLSDPRG